MGFAQSKAENREGEVTEIEVTENTKIILAEKGWKKMKRIGQGGFGKAWLVESAEGQAVCKMIDLRKTDEDDAAFKEASLLASLRHPYIVRYRDSFCTEGVLSLIMDFCDGGELAKQIRRTRRKHQKIPEELVIRWFTQALMALNYVHEKQVVHRDLKPGNFFLTKAGSLKLGDFGIATRVAGPSSTALKSGTPYYISPEVWEGQAFTAASDMWSMGCILFEMCSLKVPFWGSNIPEIAKKICQGPMPDFPSTYSPFLAQLCLRLLAPLPSARPSAVAVLSIPEFQRIEQQLLNEQTLLSEKPVAPPAPRDGPSFAVGDQVEYYSLTNCQWIGTKIIKVKVAEEPVTTKTPLQIDLKPGVWLSFEEQASRLRSKHEEEPDDDSINPSGTASNVSDDASTDAPGNEVPSVLALATCTSNIEAPEAPMEVNALPAPTGLEPGKGTFAA